VFQCEYGEHGDSMKIRLSQPLTRPDPLGLAEPASAGRKRAASRPSRGRGRFAALALPAILAAGVVAAEDPPLDLIRLPPGFTIEVFADDVPNARSMALGEKHLFVGTRTAGVVHAIALENGPEGLRAGARTELATDLYLPNGVALRQGDLYVAEVNRILRFPDVEANIDEPAYEVVYDGFPTVRHHGWKFIAFGPDDKLYVPIGAPCNVCDEEGYAVITRMNPDGSGRETFAYGVRNSVGFTWAPDTGVMWFTDNGRDWMGDEIPPCEINRAPRAGMHFGFPYCHGGDVPDPDFAAGRSCDEFTPPVQQLAAHAAPLGLRFYTGEMFPEAYRGHLFVAEHGSWNREDPIGYRVMMGRRDGDRLTDYRPFAEGWLQDGESWGRPVDILILPSGAMLVSDDKGDRIYRIRYTG
jgi:glucose/arabinose dehydrogenase